MIGWGAMCVMGLFLTGLFAGLETGVYTLNRVRLAVREARGDRAAKRLRRELADPGRTLSTLLLGTNVSSYVASYGLAALLHGAGFEGWTLVAIEAAVFTPLVFILAEVLPKDLFRTHTDRWTYRFAWLLTAVRRLMLVCLLLPLVQAVGAAARRLLGAGEEAVVTARQRISRLFKEGVGSGLLSESQTTIADRALAIRDQTVAEVMTPWSRAVTVGLRDAAPALRTVLRRSSYTRFPVVDAGGRVAGILQPLDSLLEPDRTAGELASPAHSLTPSTPVLEALRTMRAAREKMAIVSSPGGSPAGLVTLKDLVEPITGDLAAW
jgi:CBS domain containing-hemolysin-like protein